MSIPLKRCVHIEAVNEDQIDRLNLLMTDEFMTYHVKSMVEAFAPKYLLSEQKVELMNRLLKDTVDNTIKFLKKFYRTEDYDNLLEFLDRIIM